MCKNPAETTFLAVSHVKVYSPLVNELKKYMRFSFTGRLINGNLLLTRRCEQFLLYIIIKLSVTRTKHWAKAGEREP